MQAEKFRTIENDPESPAAKQGLQDRSFRLVPVY